MGGTVASRLSIQIVSDWKLKTISYVQQSGTCNLSPCPNVFVDIGVLQVHASTSSAEHDSGLDVSNFQNFYYYHGMDLKEYIIRRWNRAVHNMITCRMSFLRLYPVLWCTILHLWQRPASISLHVMLWKHYKNACFIKMKDAFSERRRYLCQYMRYVQQLSFIYLQFCFC